MFTPLQVGAKRLEHRVVMAPLTRNRGTDRFVPSPTAAMYYAERATPGSLLITEAVPISPETPWEYAPGIYTEEQEKAWRRVADAVHNRGGFISMQLWHVGRTCHGSWKNNEFLKSLGRPLPNVSASAVAVPRGTTPEYPSSAQVPFDTPRELTAHEIKTRLVEDYRRAAQAAKRAGMDFCELHAAHGYLLMQFLCDSSNKRTDEFGGPIENRMKPLHLVLQALIDVFGADRVGVRISPTYEGAPAFYGCYDSKQPDIYRTVIASLDQYKLAYLLLTEPRWMGGKEDPRSDRGFAMPVRNAWVKEVYRGVVIGAGGFTPAAAKEAIDKGVYDAIAFGRWFISNPDLVDRLRTGAELNVYDRSLFYVRDPVKGYVDWPMLDNSKKLAIAKKLGLPDIPLAAPPTMKQADVLGTTLASNQASKM